MYESPERECVQESTDFTTYIIFKPFYFGLNLSFTHQVLREANEFVWLMSDHSLIDSDIVFDMKRDRNRSLTWRIILSIPPSQS